MTKNLQGPDIDEFFCNTCLEYMELFLTEPVGSKGLIEHWECPKCQDTYSVVKKAEDDYDRTKN